jgi:hypothetical protein
MKHLERELLLHLIEHLRISSATVTTDASNAWCWLRTLGVQCVCHVLDTIGLFK